MNYQETLDWLFAQLPMYQRVGQVAYKADLKNTEQLMELLDHPETKFRSVHVAGTNGKGSVSHMLAAIFQKAGYKTGLYTSPHLVDFRERIRINGLMIPEEKVVDFVDRYQSDFISIGLSFFEMTVGMAFHYFADEKVDMAIVEVGMGGRLDSTNVIIPELSIITNISLDHTQFLGNTLPLIAREKAGIIKPGVPVVIGEANDETRPVFEEIARKRNTLLHYAGTPDPQWLSDLNGPYQPQNLATVQKSIAVLEELGYTLSENALPALKEVKRLTGLRGRWEMLQENPRVIADTGHNEAGVKLVMKQLLNETFSRLHIVWGMVGDKDSSAILKLLPQKAIYYFCKPDLPRGKDVSLLQREGSEVGLRGNSYASVQQAYAAALQTANSDDLIFIGGSTFVVAEVL
ncbi:MAG: bifunctional folylpolyglutamate synthase/dihydrofolate synthase [Owenweeksia sp.]